MAVLRDAQSRGDNYRVSVPVSRRQRDMILTGSVLNLYRRERERATPGGGEGD